MAVGRAQRMEEREARIAASYGPKLHRSVVETLTLFELAWHDCYGDVSPPEGVVDDALLVGAGNIKKLVSACMLGVTDWRDLRVAADDLRR